MQLTAMLFPPDNASMQVEEEYFSWFQNRILSPLKEQLPDLYSSVVRWYKKEISTYKKAHLDKIIAKTAGQYDKTALAKEALDAVPPLLRNTLLADSGFCGEYEIEADIIICFENPGINIRRSELFRAVKKTLSETRAEKVTAADGLEWKLDNAAGNGRLPSLGLSRGDIRFPISPSFISLSPDAETRMRFFEQTASDINLPDDAKESWLTILAKRSLENDEVETLDKDLHHTPVATAQSISGGISGKDISFTVPPSRKYFDRLVGEYDGSATIQEYAAGAARTLFKKLYNWKPYEGFLFSLFLSSHSALSAEIKTDRLNADDLSRAYDFLERHGDIVSQLGAVEVGFRILRSNPEVEPFLIRLIARICNDDVGGTTSGFKLFSALFLIVDAQLSKIRLLPSEPPFYRRLAALSQAALIHRQLPDSVVDSDSFHKWAFDNCGGEHSLQSLVDMRTEPHWNPLLGTPEQVKLNFLGRIATAAKEHERNIGTEELRKLVLGDGQESILSAAHPFRSYFPGPLDGAKGPSQDLPSEKLEDIRMQTGAEAVTPSSFIVLVNSARFFRLDSSHAELAAEALRSCHHQIAGVEDETQLSIMLNGLAAVAAVTRSHALADELRIVARRYRSDVRHSLPAGSEIIVCLTTAASRSSLEDWTEFAGSWITELAFTDEMEDDEAHMLHSQLRYLLHSVPELWVTCGRACAALAAIDKNTFSEYEDSFLAEP